jgi:IS5 family transposase
LAKKGQIVDASLIPAPIQRNKREENSKIKEGDIPDDWSETKRRQKDTDARWTQKNGKSHYGYKNHIEIDNDKKLIRKYQVTDASVHDSNVFEELLDPSNSNKDVWADSVYRSQEKETALKKKGYRSKVQRKGYKNKPLTDWEKQGNRTRSKVRSRVEHIFGAQSNLRKKAVRSIGLVRVAGEIGMMNLVYNMRRFCFLHRVATP